MSEHIMGKEIEQKMDEMHKHFDGISENIDGVITLLDELLLDEECLSHEPKTDEMHKLFDGIRENINGVITMLDELLLDEEEYLSDVECKSEGHTKYHIAYSTFVVVSFKGQFGIGSIPFHGSFHVFKHSKADGMKTSIAEVNVTSPERIMCGHFLLCYCCLLLFQQSRCQIHLICRYCLESHHFF